MYLRTSELATMTLGFGGHTCNWGAHFCGLYETQSEREAIMYGFLAQGVVDNELLICCPSEENYAMARDSICAICPDAPIPGGDSFRLLHSHELYHPEGFFSPQHMLKAHNEIWAENLSKGARNVRGTAEMGWALERIPGVEHLMAYESLLNHFIWGKTWISICLYDVNRFPGATVMKVLQTHPFVITGGGIYENPYFISPDNWLARYAPEFL
jgi:hypothetical protein